MMGGDACVARVLWVARSLACHLTGDAQDAGDASVPSHPNTTPAPTAKLSKFFRNTKNQTYIIEGNAP